MNRFLFVIVSVIVVYVFGIIPFCLVVTNRAYGNKNGDEFKCLVSEVFEMMNQVLAINNEVISITQVQNIF